MKQVISLLLGLVFVLVPTTAAADVEVQPDNVDPSLVLEGVRRRGGDLAAEVESGVGRRTGPMWDKVALCPVDADVGNYGCRNVDPEDENDGDLTEGDILRAVREIGLPRLGVRVQPGERTLVNVRTVFSAEPQQFRRSVELLGFDVDLVASPMSYTWNHGDGTSHRTSRPGRPYPSFDVTYRYRKAADVVRPSVDVTYRVRYRVDGGAWSTLSQTVTAPGPTTRLEVDEAVPVLTAP